MTQTTAQAKAEPAHGTFWNRIGGQLRYPRDRLGRTIGHLMVLANRHANRLAIDALQIRPTDEILELGFGPGDALSRLAKLAPSGQITGIDQSLAMLEMAGRRNRSAIAKGQMHLRLGRFEALPLADGSVDKILAVNVAYFWTHPALVVNEIERVLRPGGRLAIYVTDKSAMRDWKFAGPDTHRQFDAAELSRFLSGFRGIAHVEHVGAGFGIAGLLAVLERPSLEASVPVALAGTDVRS